MGATITSSTPFHDVKNSDVEDSVIWNGLEIEFHDTFPLMNIAVGITPTLVLPRSRGGEGRSYEDAEAYGEQYVMELAKALDVFLPEYFNKTYGVTCNSDEASQEAIEDADWGRLNSAGWGTEFTVDQSHPTYASRSEAENAFLEALEKAHVKAAAQVGDIHYAIPQGVVVSTTQASGTQQVSRYIP